MALVDRAVAHPLAAILDDVAGAFGRLGLKRSPTAGQPAVMRVELEENVARVVQAYWTPFQANIPGQSVGLHLEIAEPLVHWVEGYLSPTQHNWVFAFTERADGEIQLQHYGDYATPQKALEEFLNIASWYALIPTDRSWNDFVYDVSPELPWNEHLNALAGETIAPAVQESIKKSTIIWLRWTTPAGQERTMPVWFVLDGGKIYVLTGERQQTIPDAERLRECTVILRWKGKQARVAEIPAIVRVLDKGPEWDQISEKIAEKRLNIPGLPEDTARRWRDECHILELTLQGQA